MLGAGTMGSRIAAHIANAGTPVVLLDIVPAAQPPRESPRKRSKRCKKSKPAAFFDTYARGAITTGNFDDDLKLLADCDWIIEAVTENLEIKRSLLREDRAASASRMRSSPPTPAACPSRRSREACRRRSGATGSGPTSSTRRATCGCWKSSPRRKPTRPRSKPIEQFCRQAARQESSSRGHAQLHRQPDRHLLMLEASASCRRRSHHRGGGCADWFGPRVAENRDVPPRRHGRAGRAGHVAANFRAVPTSGTMTCRRSSRPMLERRWLGDKTGQGFYSKVKDAEGKELRLAWTGRPSNTGRRQAQAARRSRWPRTSSRCRSACGRCSRRSPEGQGGAFHWRVLPELWNYAANCLPEISDDIAGVDRAMRAGFNWEIGPFELWDAAGVPRPLSA